MLLTEEQAKKIDPLLEKDDIKALEAVIRANTNNHFHRNGYKPLLVKLEGGKLYFKAPINLFSVGSTVEIHGTPYLDGFYTVSVVGDGYIEVEEATLAGNHSLVGANLYLIEYPADVVAGAKKVIKYKAQMANKVGVKSETVSRVSVTYYEVNRHEGVIDGVPSYLWSFLDPYRKLRWV